MRSLGRPLGRRFYSPLKMENLLLFGLKLELFFKWLKQWLLIPIQKHHLNLRGCHSFGEVASDTDVNA